MKQKIFALIIFSALMLPITAHPFCVGINDEHQVGINIPIGVPFGEFNKEYKLPVGAELYGQGLFLIEISCSVVFYPELKTGWFTMSHVSEKNRYLHFVPLQFNFALMMDELLFDLEIVSLRIKPYAGLGLYYIAYQSDRKFRAGLDSGYQLGVNNEFQIKSLDKFFVLFSVEHFMIFETGASMPGLFFSIGAGYYLF